MPEYIACTLCHREEPWDWPGWQRTLIGPVCDDCWRTAHPEAAPYWAEHVAVVRMAAKLSARKRERTRRLA